MFLLNINIHTNPDIKLGGWETKKAIHHLATCMFTSVEHYATPSTWQFTLDYDGSA